MLGQMCSCIGDKTPADIVSSPGSRTSAFLFASENKEAIAHDLQATLIDVRPGILALIGLCQSLCAANALVSLVRVFARVAIPLDNLLPGELKRESERYIYLLQVSKSLIGKVAVRGRQ